MDSDMAFTNNKVRPVVVKAIVESVSPEAEKSLARLSIDLLGKRLAQLDADIAYAQREKQKVLKLRNDLLDNFPEREAL